MPVHPVGGDLDVDGCILVPDVVVSRYSSAVETLAAWLCEELITAVIQGGYLQEKMNKKF